jgi:hypothetical protein
MGNDATTLWPVTAEELDEARRQGHQDATELISDRAPTDLMLRMAWAAGYGQIDAIRDAVSAARDAGITWRQIGDALGENWRTVQSRYGGGSERTRRYTERQRQREDESENK